MGYCLLHKAHAAFAGAGLGQVIHPHLVASIESGVAKSRHQAAAHLAGQSSAGASSKSSQGWGAKRSPQPCSPKMDRCRLQAICRAASGDGASISDTFMRFRMGSGIERSSLAVVIQITWLASIATSANSSVKARAVSCRIVL